MDTAPVVVTFDGSQTIANIESSHQRMCFALDSARMLSIDLSAVSEVDLSFLQLLIATRKAAIAVGQGIAWAGTTNQSLASAAARAGLTASGLFEDLKSNGDPQ